MAMQGMRFVNKTVTDVQYTDLWNAKEQFDAKSSALTRWVANKDIGTLINPAPTLLGKGHSRTVAHKIFSQL